MPDYPDTRASLIVRLRDRADQEAWGEFVEVYRPVVYRLACRKGLQHADAEDLAQQVLSAVAAAVDRWEPDESRGRFRAWLHRIAQNLIINTLTRRAPDRASGNAAQHDMLSQQEAREGPDSELLRIEYRREIFNWAARQIKAEFQTETWDAFWQTAVEERPVPEVARLLGKKPGAIYAARGRVMRRLKEKILEWEGAQ
ncbi:MAG TPA: sigma-70 family RNA polymerase sigma factor [Gemmataceae bacterium]|nr:sigma-70 family RNA polymerase sigma factor [Gemmataceae bacterium]